MGIFDIGSLLRRRNIFGNGGAQAPPSPFSKLSFQGEEQEPVDVLPSRRLDTNPSGPINSPDGPAMSRYKQFLAEPAPQVEDYKPGKLRRLTAALAGISKQDPLEAEKVLLQPYGIAVDQYNRRGDVLSRGAKLENEQGQQAFDRDIKQRTTSVAEKNAESLAGNRASLVDSRAAKQRLAEYRALNPNKKLTQVKGGNLMAFDPATGELEDTGIGSGMLSDKDLQELKQSGVMQQIGARTAGSIAVENVRSNNRLNENDQKQDHRMELARFAAEHRDGKLVYEPGGNVYIVKSTGEKIDTGIEAGKLSEKDKQYYDMVKIGLRGEETRKNITAQGEQNRKTKATARPTTTTTKQGVFDDKGVMTGVKTTTTQGSEADSNATITDPETGDVYRVSDLTPEELAEAKNRGWK